jgi:hypothetical protein
MGWPQSGQDWVIVELSFFRSKRLARPNNVGVGYAVIGGSAVGAG